MQGYLSYHRRRRLEAWDNAYERPLSHPTLQSYHDDPIDLKEMLNIGYQGCLMLHILNAKLNAIISNIPTVYIWGAPEKKLSIMPLVIV